MWRFLGKCGLIAWMTMALIAANLTTAKNVDLFGMQATLGTVMFASTFLATDIITEAHGKQTAAKCVIASWVGALAFLAFTALAVQYVPNELDFISTSMSEVFSYNFQITGASLVMCLVANLADVWLYSKIRLMAEGKHMWLRNNVATITCNCLENFLFIGLAFYGVLPFENLVIIALTTTVLEVFLAVLDTPFLYLAKHVGSIELSEADVQAD